MLKLEASTQKILTQIIIQNRLVDFEPVRLTSSSKTKNSSYKLILSNYKLNSNHLQYPLPSFKEQFIRPRSPINFPFNLISI